MAENRSRVAGTTMKVLCIHGAGERPQDFKDKCFVFEEELRQMIGPFVEFKYYSGILPGGGTATNFSSTSSSDTSFRTHFNGRSQTSVYVAVAALYEHILLYGPFEGVLAFSFGAALATTAIILHSRICEDARTVPEPLFKFAAFVCGTPLHLIPYLPKEAKYGFASDFPSAGDMKDIARSSAERLLLATREAIPIDTPTSSTTQPALESAVITATDPELFPNSNILPFSGIRLDTALLNKIPTFHMAGGKTDYLRSASLALYRMCEGSDKAEFAEHHEGHQMPVGTTKAHLLAIGFRRAMLHALAQGASPPATRDIPRERRELNRLNLWCNRVTSRASAEIKQRQKRTWVLIGMRHGVRPPLFRPILPPQGAGQAMTTEAYGII